MDKTKGMYELSKMSARKIYETLLDEVNGNTMLQLKEYFDMFLSSNQLPPIDYGCVEGI